MFTCLLTEQTRSRRSDRFYTGRCLHLVAALIIVSASGCSRAPHSENIKQGDADYPAANPHPEHIINLTVIIPSSIKVQLNQGYIARSGGGSVDSGPHCAYIQTTSQARFPYGVTPALDLNRIATDVFSAQIVLDRYSPGWCNWGFAGVWYKVGDRDQGELLRVDRPQAPIGNGRMDLWCLRHPKRDPRIPDACMDIRAVRQQFPEEISAATLAEIEASGGGGEVPMYITPNLQTLVIQFHDLAAPGRDLRLRVN
jgi:hypothetical protein